MHSGQYFEICDGWHKVFCSECWAKTLSPGQARPAPPTVATTPVELSTTSFFFQKQLLKRGLHMVLLQTSPNGNIQQHILRMLEQRYLCSG